jgi:hypothetical protein
MMPVVQLAPASGIMEKEGTRKAYVFKKNDPAGLWIGTGDEISKWKIQSIDADVILYETVIAISICKCMETTINDGISKSRL